MNIIVANDRDPITLEPLENCRRLFFFSLNNVRTVYDFDHYNENIKQIGDIIPHTGEKLTSKDKLSLNRTWSCFNEPIPFPEEEIKEQERKEKEIKEKERKEKEIKEKEIWLKVRKEKEKERKEKFRIGVIGWFLLFVAIVEFIFLCKCNGFHCIGG